MKMGLNISGGVRSWQRHHQDASTVISLLEGFYYCDTSNLDCV